MSEKVEEVKNIQEGVVEGAGIELVELPEVPNCRYTPEPEDTYTQATEETIVPVEDEALTRELIGKIRSPKSVLILCMLLKGYSKSEIVRYFEKHPFTNAEGVVQPIPFQVIFPIWSKLKTSGKVTVVNTTIYKPARTGADGMTVAQRKEKAKAEKAEKAAKKAENANKGKTSGQIEQAQKVQETSKADVSPESDNEAVAKL